MSVDVRGRRVDEFRMLDTVRAIGANQRVTNLLCRTGSMTNVSA
jgi:hypothetical protein